MFLDVDRPVATPRPARVRRVGRIAGALAAVGCLGLGGLLAAQEVRVAQGDTVSSIARRTGSSVAAIAQANGLADPNRIVVGQVLIVPGPASSPSPPPPAAAPAGATSGTHVVQAGDTLSSIARRFGTTVGAIQLANGIVDANRIRVGTSLTVPGSPATAPATPAPAPAVTPTPAPASATGAPAGRTVSVSYVVRNGDSLSSIAQRFGVRLSALRTANRLTGDQLSPGQRLSIPLAG
jgi:LysM repeat protein